MLVMITNSVQFLSLICFANQPLHVSEVFNAHHQEVFTVYVQRLVRVIRLGYWQLAGSEWNWFLALETNNRRMEATEMDVLRRSSRISKIELKILL
jgi:hypothetical protein